METKSIIYIRTSTEEQEPENQIRDCSKLLGKEYVLFQDKQSAYKDNKEREGFENAKKLIKKGKIDSFVVWDLDRIYRNRIKLKEFFQFCKIYRCSIHSVNQQWLEELTKIPAPFNDMMHDLMLNLMGWLAEDESKKKSDRVKLAIRRTPGKPTMSYKGKKWGRRKMPIAEKRIIELHKEGKNLREICEEIYYWDKNNHKKFVSLGFTHKVVNEYKNVHKPIVNFKEKLNVAREKEIN